MIELIQRPIPTTDRLPDPGVRVLAYVPGVDWFTLTRIGDMWDGTDADLHQIDDREPTHWLPMPPEPTGEA